MAPNLLRGVSVCDKWFMGEDRDSQITCGVWVNAAGHYDPLGSRREEGSEPVLKTSARPRQVSELSHQQLIIKTLCIDLISGRRP